MNEQEAITRAEAWYFQRYHAVAQGHLPLDTDRQALNEDPFVCIDLVPEFQAKVVKVLLYLAGEEVVLLEEGRPCPRCISGKKTEYTGWLKGWINWRARLWGKRHSNGA